MAQFEYQLDNQIMASDLYVFFGSPNYTLSDLEKLVVEVVESLKRFEFKFSRFIKGNVLDQINNSIQITIDEETLELLLECKKYFAKTKGLFDPTVYSALLNEGYNVSKSLGFYNKNENAKETYVLSDFSFDQIELNKKDLVLKKPLELKLDFGGIGKSFIIQNLVNSLPKDITNFCISLGGDMYLGGVDVSKGYDYWAIEVENTTAKNLETPTLLLSDIAVATSGTYKRNWKKGSVLKNHIIDNSTKNSTRSDILSCSVISNDIVYADIYAKTLLIMGLDKAINYCEENLIPAVFISNEHRVKISSAGKKFIWKED